MRTRPRIVTRPLIDEIRGQFRLDWQGHHGIPHWARVYRHGQVIGAQVGANLDVCELFAFMHDARRTNEYEDPDHGARAADYALQLRERGFFDLDDSAMELLRDACIGHSDGNTDADPTVQACWDADRLDLGRVGIRPAPRYLCTAFARDPARIEDAYRRSIRARPRRPDDPGLSPAAAQQGAWYEDEDGIVRLSPF
jgi:uncharacterized protein